MAAYTFRVSYFFFSKCLLHNMHTTAIYTDIVEECMCHILLT